VVKTRSIKKLQRRTYTLLNPPGVSESFVEVSSFQNRSSSMKESKLVSAKSWERSQENGKVSVESVSMIVGGAEQEALIPGDRSILL
jgi:hypothetical protein